MKVATTTEAKKLFGFSSTGIGYEIDPVTKTCRKVLADMIEEETDLMSGLLKEQTSLKIYRTALKEKFPTESVKLNKGVILFRGYRLRFTDDAGFVIEDTATKLKEVKTFEDLPALEELIEFFNFDTTKMHTPQELEKATKLGKMLQEQKEMIEEDYKSLEDYRKEVIAQLKKLEVNGKGDFDVTLLSNMIPYKKWKRKANALVKALSKREIRFKKFIKEMQNITASETFGEELKAKRSKFKGTTMPEFKDVGYVYSNKIEVDGRLTDAVPFLMEYLLFCEPKVMPQLMRFAKGEINQKEMFEDIYKLDCFQEYDKFALKNTEENTAILLALYDVAGIITPQELAYETGLEIGNVIKLWDGETFKNKTVRSLEDGVLLTGDLTLTKTDKWFKVEQAETIKK